ncbi:unnamed protein product [Cuscuta campestris]|uniref:Uncharacterized protein n=2 Tax=Cuscuta sect. Cleistogrammica TaxID=1824901 RepID=A0A484MKJ4_9ASTE|nr:hypothetical protein DM860_001933 [Cuscuta australis]VFQ88564.1 unnamed protein product [Cuscuta campestris]
MHARYMDRSSSIAREKRALDPGNGSEDVQPEKKRPALASVIIEALKVDSLQRLCSSLEPILRRVVSEEVERALAKLGPARINERVSPKSIEGPDGRNLQLQFRSKLSLPLFTGGKVEGEQGAALHVVLLDGNTGHIITSGPESSVKLDVVVLDGGFNNEDEDGWSQEEFESNIVKEREGKRPLLTGDLQVILKDGVGTLGELTFTDNSSWIRSRKFRLGLKVTSGFCEGIHIREAKTDAFTVKDHRGELYKKHYPPALSDEVWRLEKIGKDGSFHKRLNKSGIHNVEEFLRFVVRDPQRLRNILGSGMSNKMWEALVEHAKTCVLSGKLYVYYPDDLRNVGVAFNNVYELCGLIAGGEYHSVDSLSDHQKVYVDTLVRKAYENWMHVVEYDGRALMSLNENKSTDSSRNCQAIGSHDHSNSFNHQINNISSLSNSSSSEQSSIGYDPNNSSGYAMHSSNVDVNTDVHLNDVSFQHQLVVGGISEPSPPPPPQQLALTCGNNYSLPLLSPPGAPILTPYQGPTDDDCFFTEEIRLRSHQMLENDDMQHLLHIFNTEESYLPYTAAAAQQQHVPVMPPSFGFSEEPSQSSGKAVVGWLKLKAALRWGIFVRKKAAERRRAQIVELD